MDLFSWIVVGGVIVLAAVGVGLWNRFGKRSSAVDRLDPAAAKSVQDAQREHSRYGSIGGTGGGGNVGGGGM